MQSMTTLFPCDRSFLHTNECSQSIGVFRLFSLSAARQWFSVDLNHVQIVPAFMRSLSRVASTAWHLTYECILMIRLPSNVSSIKSKSSSPPMVFFIIAPMASNDKFLCVKGDKCLERIRYSIFHYNILLLLMTCHLNFPPLMSHVALHK